MLVRVEFNTTSLLGSVLGLLIAHARCCSSPPTIKGILQQPQWPANPSQATITSLNDQIRRDRNDEIEALEAIYSAEFHRIDNNSFKVQIYPDLCIRIDHCQSKLLPSYQLDGKYLNFLNSEQVFISPYF
jgi:hypothetical protein